MLPSGPIWPTAIESRPQPQSFKGRLPIHDKNSVKLKARLEKNLDGDQNKIIIF